jgi:hypothetical protein
VLDEGFASPIQHRWINRRPKFAAAIESFYGYIGVEDARVDCKNRPA